LKLARADVRRSKNMNCENEVGTVYDGVPSREGGARTDQLRIMEGPSITARVRAVPGREVI